MIKKIFTVLIGIAVVALSVYNLKVSLKMNTMSYAMSANVEALASETSGGPSVPCDEFFHGNWCARLQRGDKLQFYDVWKMKPGVD